MARLPDGWVFIPRVEGPRKEDGQLVVTVSVDEKELVMCKHCKYRYNCKHCHGDDWYCADGEQEGERWMT